MRSKHDFFADSKGSDEPLDRESRLQYASRTPSHAAKRGGRSLDHLLDTRGLTEVGGHGQYAVRAAGVRSDRGRGGFETRRRPRTQCDAAALGGQRGRGGETKATTRARHDGDLVGQVQVHDVIIEVTRHKAQVGSHNVRRITAA